VPLDFLAKLAPIGRQQLRLEISQRLVDRLGEITIGRIGQPYQKVEPEFLCPRVAQGDQRGVAGDCQGDRFAVLNCGAAWPNKRWPPDRFGHLARWLRERHGLPSVALWGPGERPLAERVVQVSGQAALVAPPTSLTDLVAITARAALMVSGDTGPTHVAAALGTPVVALFGPTSAERNGPWVEADECLSRYSTCECHYQRECKFGDGSDRWCLGTIPEDDVRAAIDRRLAVRDER